MHQDRHQLEDFVCRLHRDAVVHASFCPADHGGSAAGGVATILPRIAYSADVSSVSTPAVQGRVLRVDICGPGAQLVHFNIHNHGLTAKQVDDICAEIDAARAHAAADPLHCMVIIQGDLNFGPDEALVLHRPVKARTTDPRNHRALAARWWRSLGALPEIASESPTHYTKDTNSVSCLGRFF